jgi:hypothetical protein
MSQDGQITSIKIKLQSRTGAALKLRKILAIKPTIVGTVAHIQRRGVWDEIQNIMMKNLLAVAP